MFDVTLVTDDGQHIKAHKIILSAGSQFFSDIFLKINQTIMLICVYLGHLLDFIYNGEASVGQEEFKEFLEAGKELKVKGFEAYVSGVEERDEEEPVRYINDNKNRHANRKNTFEENIKWDILETPEDNDVSSEGALKEIDEETLQINRDLDLRTEQMILKTDSVWKCKVCGKTNPLKSVMQIHAKTHLEGMSHACHICNKIYHNRPSLRVHISLIHSELSSCDLCGKSGMNKKSLRSHKARNHKTLSGSLS